MNIWALILIFNTTSMGIPADTIARVEQFPTKEACELAGKRSTHPKYICIEISATKTFIVHELDSVKRQDIQ